MILYLPIIRDSTNICRNLKLLMSSFGRQFRVLKKQSTGPALLTRLLTRLIELMKKEHEKYVKSMRALAPYKRKRSNLRIASTVTRVS
jgi:hypothetical protein